MKKKSESITERTLRELGKVIPGLGSLVNIAKMSPAFQTKLKEKDEEIEKKLKENSWDEEFQRKGERLRTTTIDGATSKEHEVELFDEGDYLRVILELPGVNEEEIKLDIKESVLLISASSVEHEYLKRVQLPFVPKEKAIGNYKNGVLEVRIVK